LRGRAKRSIGIGVAIATDKKQRQCVENGDGRVRFYAEDYKLEEKLPRDVEGKRARQLWTPYWPKEKS
jgi:hypothetical protein